MGFRLGESGKRFREAKSPTGLLSALNAMEISFKSLCRAIDAWFLRRRLVREEYNNGKDVHESLKSDYDNRLADLLGLKLLELEKKINTSAVYLIRCVV